MTFKGSVRIRRWRKARRSWDHRHTWRVNARITETDCSLITARHHCKQIHHMLFKKSASCNTALQMMGTICSTSTLWQFSCIMSFMSWKFPQTHLTSCWTLKSSHHGKHNFPCSFEVGDRYTVCEQTIDESWESVTTLYWTDAKKTIKTWEIYKEVLKVQLQTQIVSF